MARPRRFDRMPDDLIHRYLTTMLGSEINNFTPEKLLDEALHYDGICQALGPHDPAFATMNENRTLYEEAAALRERAPQLFNELTPA
jgi:hypothetical protein